MKNVFIVGGSYAYRLLFQNAGFGIVHEIQKADLVCFTGGEDVSPHLYGDMNHKNTFNNVARDKKEMEVFHSALGLKIPMVGICRGGQFLNVMSGGRMYQHVDRHCQDHVITDVESGSQIYVTSTHHQMMMPAANAELIAYANLGGFREWYEGEVFKRDVSNTDYEVVYYEHTNALCFQPHPEFDGRDYDGMREYFFSLLAKKVMK